MALGINSSIGFSLAQGILILNGVRVTGWADDSAAFEPPEITLLNTVTGADGQTVFLPTSQKGGVYNIKLLQNSLAILFLNDNFQKIKAGVYDAMKGTFADPRTGSSIDLNGGYIVSGHEFPSLGAGASGAMSYNIFFSNTASLINNFLGS
jgi:hypothetical protein